MTRTERWDHLVKRFESWTELQRRSHLEGETKEDWETGINKMYGWIIAAAEFNPDLEDDISTLWTETYNREFSKRFMN